MAGSARYSGPIEEAPVGSWVRYPARPGQVWHVRHTRCKDGSVVVYGGSPSPEGQRQFHMVPAGTHVKEVPSPQAGRRSAV